jgi:uncharacterized BrkB/YihY/UPF0761 family membrane protein
LIASLLAARAAVGCSISCICGLIEGLVGRVRSETFIGGLVLTVLEGAVIGPAWLYIEWVMPRPPESTLRDVVPGAVLFTLGSVALHVVTISPSFENKSETYGAVGGALALLFWAYLVRRLVTSSAVLNRVLFDRRADNNAGSAAPTSS